MKPTKWQVFKFYWKGHYVVNNDQNSPMYGGKAFWIRTWLFSFGIYRSMPEMNSTAYSDRIELFWLPVHWNLTLQSGESMYRHCFSWKSNIRYLEHFA